MHCRSWSQSWQLQWQFNRNNSSRYYYFCCPLFFMILMHTHCVIIYLEQSDKYIMYTNLITSKVIYLYSIINWPHWIRYLLLTPSALSVDIDYFMLLLFIRIFVETLSTIHCILLKPRKSFNNNLISAVDYESINKNVTTSLQKSIPAGSRDYHMTYSSIYSYILSIIHTHTHTFLLANVLCHSFL